MKTTILITLLLVGLTGTGRSERIIIDHAPCKTWVNDSSPSRKLYVSSKTFDLGKKHMTNISDSTMVIGNGFVYADSNSVISIDSTSPTRIPVLDSIYDEFVRVVKSAQPIYYWSDSISTPAYDTIPVILLVCDTSHIIKNYLISDSIRNDTATGNRWYCKEISKDMGQSKWNVYWMNGYLLSKKTGYYNVAYLDSKKKPINSSIIVWDYKSRKR